MSINMFPCMIFCFPISLGSFSYAILSRMMMKRLQLKNPYAFLYLVYIPSQSFNNATTTSTTLFSPPFHCDFRLSQLLRFYIHIHVVMVLNVD